jgi:hypothetical protein
VQRLSEGEQVFLPLSAKAESLLTTRCRQHTRQVYLVDETRPLLAADGHVLDKGFEEESQVVLLFTDAQLHHRFQSVVEIGIPMRSGKLAICCPQTDQACGHRGRRFLPVLLILLPAARFLPVSPAACLWTGSSGPAARPDDPVGLIDATRSGFTIHHTAVMVNARCLTVGRHRRSEAVVAHLPEFCNHL